MEEDKMESDIAKIAIATVFAILVIADVVGNTMVCMVVLKNQEMRTIMNFLLVNLAVADIMVAVFITPQFVLIHAFKHPEGLIGTWFCKVLTGGNLMWAGATASSFTLVTVAFDRYYAVMYPYNSKAKITTKKLRVILPAIWISSAIVNAPTFLSTFYSKEENICSEFWPREWMAKAYSVTWFILLGVFPILAMTVLYSRIVYSLWLKHEERVDCTQQGVMKIRKRVTKMAAVVSAVYSLCWIPDLIIYAMIHFSSHRLQLGGVADIISIVLVTLNSTANPFIYAYVSVRFRQKIKKLMRCATGTGQKVDVFRVGFRTMTTQGDEPVVSLQWRTNNELSFQL